MSQVKEKDKRFDLNIHEEGSYVTGRAMRISVVIKPSKYKKYANRMSQRYEKSIIVTVTHRFMDHSSH